MAIEKVSVKHLKLVLLSVFLLAGPVHTLANMLEISDSIHTTEIAREELLREWMKALPLDERSGIIIQSRATTPQNTLKFCTPSGEPCQTIGPVHCCSGSCRPDPFFPPFINGYCP